MVLKVSTLAFLVIRQVSRERAALEDVICETSYEKIPLRSTVDLIQNEKVVNTGIKQALHIQHFWT